MMLRPLHWWASMPGLVILFAPLAHAQNEAGSDLTFSLLRALLALVFVLALFFLLIFIIRRYYPKVLQQLPHAPSSGERIEIRSSRALGPKRFLYVVKVGKTNYLLGGTDHSLNKIDQWSEDCEQNVEIDSEQNTLNKFSSGEM